MIQTRRRPVPSFIFNMQLSCIITDDEPVASGILEDYVRLVPGLRLLASCRDAMETGELLRREPVDILFLDIQMPGISGLDFVRSLRQPPAVIFTTAHPGFAVDAFELEVADYLLKPVPIDRFLRAVNKVIAGRRPEQPVHRDEGAQVPEQPGRFFFVKSNQDLVKIACSDIFYVEGLENYVKIHCADKTVVSFATMKSMEELLAPQGFLRIHRSYIVNLNKVDTIRNNVFCLRNTELVVGKSYRKPVAELLKHYYAL